MAGQPRLSASEIFLSASSPGRAFSVISAREKAILSASAAQAKDGENIAILEVARLTAMADFFVFCSAQSRRQVLAIADGIDASLSRKGLSPLSVEGRKNALWILMDYNDLIVHLFEKQAMEFYDLERLWGDATRLPLPKTARSPRVQEG